MAREETYIVNTQLNAVQAKNELKELERRVAATRSEMDKAYASGDKALGDKLHKDLVKAQKEMGGFRVQTRNVSDILDSLSDASINQLRKAAKSLTMQMKNLGTNTAEFAEKSEQLQKVKGRLKELRSEGQEQRGWIGRTTETLNENWGAVTQVLGAFTGLSMTIRKATQDYADMEEAMADVQKYTGQTTEEVHAMNEELKKLDTRTSREKLNALAGDAGRLGITGKDGIMEFIDAADKINVALGDDLGDDAVKNIGKLAQAFGEDKDKGLRGAMLSSGSAVNELAQSSSAAAGYIVNFTARLAGVGTQARMSQTDIMGFASVLDQNMQQEEMAATALSQFISKMFQDPAKFAKIAGKDVKEFTGLLQTDANKAILSFLDAMQQKGGFDQLAPMFDDMGLSGTRATGVLSTLAAKLGDVKEAQNTAAQAYAVGTSVLDEYDIQNNTVQAGIDKAKKEFTDLSVTLGERLMPVVQYAISAGSVFVKVLGTAADFALSHSRAILTLVAAITAYTVIAKADLALTAAVTKSKKVYAAAVAWLTAQSKAYTAALILERDAVSGCSLAQSRLTKVMAAGSGVTKAMVAVTALVKAAYYALTLQFTAAGRAMTAFNVIVKANPWGAAAAVVLAAAAAFAAWYAAMDKTSKAARENAKRLKELSEAQKQVNGIKEEANRQTASEKTRLEALNQIIHDNSCSVRDRKNAIAAVQKVIPQYHASINKEGRLINDNTDSIKKYIAQLNAAAVAQAAFEKLADLQRQKMDALLKAQRKKTNVNAVNREIARGTKTGEYKKDTKITGLGGLAEQAVVVDNDALRAKKAELAIQQEALKTANDEVASLNRQIDAVNSLVESNRKYKKAMDDISMKGSAGTSAVTAPAVQTAYDTGAQKKDRERAEKDSAAQAKKERDEDVRSAKAAADKEVADALAAYSRGETNYEEYLSACEKALTDSVSKRRELYRNDRSQLDKLYAEEKKIKLEYDTKGAKASLVEIEQDQRAVADSLQRDFENADSAIYQDRMALEEALFNNEYDSMKAKQELYAAGSEEYRRLSCEIAELVEKHQFEKAQTYTMMKSQYLREYAEADQKKLVEIALRGADGIFDYEKKALEEKHAEGLLSEEGYQTELNRITEEHARMRGAVTFQASQNTPTSGETSAGEADKALNEARRRAGDNEKERYGGSDSYGVGAIADIVSELEAKKDIFAQLDDMEKKSEITHKQCEDAKAKASKQAWKAIASEASAVMSSVNSVMSSMSSYASACYEAEIAAVERRYDAEIEAAGEDQEKVAKLEEEKQEETNRIKLKQIETEAKISTAQVLIDTAMAVAKGYADYGPILGSVLAALSLAMGVMQVATIQKQAEAQKAALEYYEGGYTGGSRYRKEAGVVHEGEFVANHNTVNNPNLTPLLDMIDAAQRNNTSGSLTDEDLRAVTGTGGSAAIVSPVVNVTTDNGELQAALSKVERVMAGLEAGISGGIRAYSVVSGPDGSYEQTRRYEKLLKNKAK